MAAHRATRCTLDHRRGKQACRRTRRCARSIEHRFPYLDPLNHLQVELMRRYRQRQADDPRSSACGAASTSRSTASRRGCAIPAEGFRDRAVDAAAASGHNRRMAARRRTLQRSRARSSRLAGGRIRPRPSPATSRALSPPRSAMRSKAASTARPCASAATSAVRSSTAPTPRPSARRCCAAIRPSPRAAWRRRRSCSGASPAPSGCTSPCS